jgi:hypothetical protein
MELIAARVRIAADPTKVLQAVTTSAGVCGWWTEGEIGTAVGDEALLRFDSGEVVFVIDRLDSRGIELTCLRAEGQRDWQGTHLAIRAIEDGNGTYVDLVHDGYPQRNAFYEQCVAAWSHYLHSLRVFCETGRGAPLGSTLHPSATMRAAIEVPPSSESSLLDRLLHRSHSAG